MELVEREEMVYSVNFETIIRIQNVMNCDSVNKCAILFFLNFNVINFHNSRDASWVHFDEAILRQRSKSKDQCGTHVLRSHGHYCFELLERCQMLGIHVSSVLFSSNYPRDAGRFNLRTVLRHLKKGLWSYWTSVITIEGHQFEYRRFVKSLRFHRPRLKTGLLWY